MVEIDIRTSAGDEMGWENEKLWEAIETNRLMLVCIEKYLAVICLSRVPAKILEQQNLLPQILEITGAKVSNILPPSAGLKSS